MSTALRPGSFRTPSPRRYRTPVWLQTKTSDDWEGTVAWIDNENGFFYVDIQPKRYVIRTEGDQETLVDKLIMRTAWRSGVELNNDCVQRFRTETEGLFYHIESVVDVQSEDREYEIIATQRLEVLDSLGVPLLPLSSGLRWVTLNGNPVVRLGTSESAPGGWD